MYARIAKRDNHREFFWDCKNIRQKSPIFGEKMNINYIVAMDIYA